jgi:hypothetical protein
VHPDHIRRAGAKRHNFSQRVPRPSEEIQKHPEEYELFSGIIAQVMKLLRINVSQFLMVFVL